MATPLAITTGEQTVAATGAITGVLDTSALTDDATLRIRVRGLAAGKTVRIAVEDTANATAFSEAQVVKTFNFTGAPTEGTEQSVRLYELGDALRWGGANNKLRLNCTEITAGGTCKVYGWLEQ